jgi:hypothetical protein
VGAVPDDLRGTVSEVANLAQGIALLLASAAGPTHEIPFRSLLWVTS